MTTRREIITGMAVLPLADISVAADTARAPALSFRHEPDTGMFRDLETVERMAAIMKTKLIEANTDHALARAAALMELRCSLAALQMTLNFVTSAAMAQRDESFSAVAVTS